MSNVQKAVCVYTHTHTHTIKFVNLLRTLPGRCLQWLRSDLCQWRRAALSNAGFIPEMDRHHALSALALRRNGSRYGISRDNNLIIHTSITIVTCICVGGLPLQVTRVGRVINIPLRSLTADLTCISKLKKVASQRIVTTWNTIISTASDPYKAVAA